MLEEIMQKTYNIIIDKAQKGANKHQKSINNKIKQMMEKKKRLRQILYGGPLVPTMHI